MSYEIKGSIIVDDDRNIIDANTYNGYIPVNPTLSFSAGNGMVGGGNLTANRSFSVRAGDGLVANTTGLHVIAGQGLLANSSSLHVDNATLRKDYVGFYTVSSTTLTYADNIPGLSANTAGSAAYYHAQAGAPTDAPTVAQGSGIILRNPWWDSQLHFTNNNYIYVKTSSNPWVHLWHSGNLPNPALQSFNIIAGSGLTGGGNLTTTNRTLAVGQGDGITVAATTVGVDATVVRTAGNQTIAGVKNFSNTIIGTSEYGLSMHVHRSLGDINSRIVFTTETRVDDVYVGQGDTGWFNVGGSDLRYGASGTFGVSASTGEIKWKGTASGNGAGITSLTAGNLTGTINDARIATSIARSARNISTGNGLTGGGNLSADRTLSVVAGKGIGANTSGVHVLTGNGINANNTAVWVGAGDGISVTATNVSVDSTVARLDRSASFAGSLQIKGHFYTLAPNPNANAEHWFKGPDGSDRAVIYSGNNNVTHFRSYTQDGESFKEFIFDGSIGRISADRFLGIHYGTFSGNGALIETLDGSNITLGTVADARLPSTVVRTSRSINTGAGLTGGGDLSANRTLALDVSSVSIMSGTMNDGRLLAWSSDTGQGMINQVTLRNQFNLADSRTSLTAGAGLTGGGDLSSSRTLAMGTPSSITATSTNSTTSTSHTHSISEATIRTLIADGTFNALGTYVFATNWTGSQRTRGDTAAGADLAPAGESDGERSNNGTLTGTWRCMGHAPGNEWATLWLKIS